jgi:hypothetical protein
MPHCPRCQRRYKTDEKVTRHMNQPRSSCTNLISDLISISLPSLDTSQSQNAPLEQGVDNIDMNFADESDNFAAQDDMDVEMATDNSNSFNNISGSMYREEFANAAYGWGSGETFMDKFDNDDFAEQRKTNLYYPFASKDDWEMAAFLLRSGMSMALIDDFLKLQLVSKFLCEVTI